MAIDQKNKQLKKDILKNVYYKDCLSLTELSRLTSKSLPVITSAVNDLVNEGFIIEHGLAPSTGGRRPAVFLFNRDKPLYIVAVAMDQLVTRIGIYDLLKSCVYPVKQMALNPFEDREGLDKLISFIKGEVKHSGIPKGQILGVGIGMPGFVNSEKGINESFFYTERISLKEYLSEKVGLPVFIDNDSSLIALAELRFGVGINIKELLVVNIGWGTGLGMIVNGRLFRGYNGYAGEFSHIPLSQSNNLCSCGKRGCLEVETSLLAMVEKAKTAVASGAESILTQIGDDPSRLEGDQFLEAASKGDPLALSILAESAFLLGKGISTLIHIMNPERIVLSGRGAIAGRMFLPAIQQAVNEYCIHKIAEQTTIVVSELGHQAELIGAAGLVIDNCDFN
ncbi:ROK family protein [Arcticibacter tournemirensis]